MSKRANEGGGKPRFFIYDFGLLADNFGVSGEMV
jgi:hypothetical protein